MGAIGQLIPLVLLFAFLAGGAWVGYQIYLWTNELADKGVKKLEKKNIMYTKDGMKVGVKEVNDEAIGEKMQHGLVNTWNNASFPGYKSKVWNTEATPGFNRTASSGSGSGLSARPTTQRSSSSRSGAK